MNFLVATDGMLPLDTTVRHITRLWRDGDSVVVMTAVNLPRQLLRQVNELAASAGISIEDIVEAAGPGHSGLAGGDRVADRLSRRSAVAALEQVAERHYAQVAQERTRPLVAALAAESITAITVVRETPNRTAETILEVARARRSELLIIGATGRGRFEGALGSTGTKLVRRAPMDVLLIRVPHRPPSEQVHIG
jgi:nucleotide-binding universal stress UspA family protein